MDGYINTSPTNWHDVAIMSIVAVASIATAVYIVNKDEINDYIAKKIKEKKDKREKNK